jgi:hypothetical protein
VAATVKNTGDIDVICQKADALAPGQTASIVFKCWDDPSPPFTVKVRAPDGKLILDRVIRNFPKDEPQSAPPVTFTVAEAGDYKIQISELYGKLEGEATLTVAA